MIPSRKLSKKKINFNTWNYDKQHQRDTMQRQEIYSFTFWLDPRKSNCMFILIVRYNWDQLPQTQGSVSYERWWIFRCRTSKIFKALCSNICIPEEDVFEPKKSSNHTEESNLFVFCWHTDYIIVITSRPSQDWSNSSENTSQVTKGRQRILEITEGLKM